MAAGNCWGGGRSEGVVAGRSWRVEAQAGGSNSSRPSGALACCELGAAGSVGLGMTRADSCACLPPPQTTQPHLSHCSHHPPTDHRASPICAFPHPAGYPDTPGAAATRPFVCAALAGAALTRARHERSQDGGRSSDQARPRRQVARRPGFCRRRRHVRGHWRAQHPDRLTGSPCVADARAEMVMGRAVKGRERRRDRDWPHRRVEGRKRDQGARR